MVTISRDYERDADPLERIRNDALRDVNGQRDDRSRGRDRRDDAHRPNCQAAIEGAQADQAGDASRSRREELGGAGERIARERYPQNDPGKADRL